MQYNLELGSWNKVFAVPSCLVEKYIKLASGNSLKVLLYFLNNAGQDISYEDVGKATGIKYDDVSDAVSFWEEIGLIKLEGKKIFPDEETGSKFTNSNFTKEEKGNQTEVMSKDYDMSVKKLKLEREFSFTPLEVALTVKGNSEADFLFKSCEKLFGRPLKRVEQNTLMIIIEEVGLPVECVLMLVEYCFSINKIGPSYIKTIAMDWLSREVNSLERVEVELKRMKEFNRTESELKKMFEMNSAFSKEQKEFIKKWTDIYGFSLEMLDEAYQKTLNATGKLSFPYMNSILENWRDKGIKDTETLNMQNVKYQKEKNEGKESSFDIDEITRMTMERYMEV